MQLPAHQQGGGLTGRRAARPRRPLGRPRAAVARPRPSPPSCRLLRSSPPAELALLLASGHSLLDASIDWRTPTASLPSLFQQLGQQFDVFDPILSCIRPTDCPLEKRVPAGVYSQGSTRSGREREEENEHNSRPAITPLRSRSDSSSAERRAPCSAQESPGISWSGMKSRA